MSVTAVLTGAPSPASDGVPESSSAVSELEIDAGICKGGGMEMDFDFYYGLQSQTFFFYRIPKLLFTDSRFSSLSAEAKTLYGILLDCMPSLGMLTVNALAAADNVIIPVQAQYLPAKGLEQLLQTVNKVKSQINPKLRIEGILLTIVDSRTNHVLCLFYHVPGRHPGCSWYFLY